MTPEMFNMIWLGDTQGDCENKMCLVVLQTIVGAVKSWVKVAGQWFESTIYTKVSGVWKSAMIKVKVNGNWI